MFRAIVPRYDLLNHLLSFGLDCLWRRAAARAALNGTARPLVLDLCAGTGDLALEIARRCPGARVVALDFVPEMLEKAAEKSARRGLSGRIEPLCADALRLPFGAGVFDLVTMAFGLRNISPPEGALAEARRVLRPGGRLVVLEFALPARGVWRRLYSFYFFRILPRIGRLISGSSAYEYLPASVESFADPPRLRAMIEGQGFAGAEWRVLAGGAVALHRARAV